jgi:glycosyltransferase involved in cell wall biosynthesis
MKDSLALSIVVPIYNEASGIESLHAELTRVLTEGPAPFRDQYELIFVDDGSRDGSFERCAAYFDRDPHLHVLRFQRNFGKTAALNAGFAAARGRYVVTIDADLQEDPEALFDLLAKLDEGYGMVSAWRETRNDPLSKTLPSKVFNGVVSSVTGLKLHDFNCGFKAYRREVVKELDLYGSQHRFIPLLVAQKGYRVAEVPVEHRPRQFGTSKFGARRFGRGYLDFIQVLFLTKYLQHPLRLFGSIGSILGLVGTVILAYLTVLWFLGQRPIGNRPLLTLGVLLVLTGLQLVSTGLIGEMLRRYAHHPGDDYVVREELVHGG